MKGYLETVVSIYRSGILTYRHYKILKQLPRMSSFIQTSPNEIKILGVSWNKLTNNLSISMPKFRQTVTKKNFYAQRPQYMIH